MRDKRAMAMVFDALVFLTIITVVSAALMNAVYDGQDRPGTSRYVDEVNEVSLACTFQSEDISSLMTIKEAIIQALMKNDDGMMARADAQLSAILSAYLSPEFDFYLEVLVGNEEYYLGDAAVLEDGNVFVSTIEASGDDRITVKFVLSASYA